LGHGFGPGRVEHNPPVAHFHQRLVHLVNLQVSAPVVDDFDEQPNRLRLGDAQLLRQIGKPNAFVRLDQADQDLRKEINNFYQLTCKL
jgi:hypothetical protein